jgi:flagellar biosynthesis/type III secretory pathway M-ring protein FliF/YscJ
LEEVKSLIAFSAGIGIEDIALSNMAFYNPDEPSVPVIAPETGIKGIQLREILIYGGAALALIVIIILIIVIIVNKRKKKKGLNVKEAAITSGGSEYSWTEIQEGIKVQETQEQAIKKQLKDFTKTNPEIVSQLIRTWLKGDD